MFFTVFFRFRVNNVSCAGVRVSVSRLLCFGALKFINTEKNIVICLHISKIMLIFEA